MSMGKNLKGWCMVAICTVFMFPMCLAYYPEEVDKTNKQNEDNINNLNSNYAFEKIEISDGDIDDIFKRISTFDLQSSTFKVNFSTLETEVDDPLLRMCVIRDILAKKPLRCEDREKMINSLVELLNHQINSRSTSELLLRSEADKINDDTVKKMLSSGMNLVNYVKKNMSNIEFDKEIDYNNCIRYSTDRKFYVLLFEQLVYRDRLKAHENDKDCLTGPDRIKYMDIWKVLRSIRQQFVDFYSFEDKYSCSTICFERKKNEIISLCFRDIGEVDEPGRSSYGDRWHLAELQPEVFCIIEDNGKFIYPNTCPLSEYNSLS